MKVGRLADGIVVIITAMVNVDMGRLDVVKVEVVAKDSAGRDYKKGNGTSDNTETEDPFEVKS